MGWPFKKKKEDIKDNNPYWHDEWQEVKYKFPIGHKFEYLGRTMIVVLHCNYRKGTTYFPASLPKLVCEYADELGVLHEWNFPLGRWKVLTKG